MEQTFWAVKDKLDKRKDRPKKEYDPLPLAGLLYCGKHEMPQLMSYSNQKSYRKARYRCCIHSLSLSCTAISASFLDKPIGEAFISQLTLPGKANDVLDVLMDDYEQAKEQAASYRREARRLEAEVENMRANLATEVMSAEQLQWLDVRIQERLDRIEELADLQRRPIGAAIGQSVPDKDDIELVKKLLTNLGET